jgi:hypothetical protein
MASMTIASRADIKKLVLSDAWMMDVLRAAEKLNLPDWWIGAGFLRNKIWDAIERIDLPPNHDVDLVYFNAEDMQPETDWAYDEKLKRDFGFAEWEVRNQARMHNKNGFEPFISTEDAISHWIETATCVAVKLKAGELQFLFCYGTEDLLSLLLRPSPYIKDTELMTLFHKRVEEKDGVRGGPISA